MTDIQYEPRIKSEASTRPVALWGIGTANPADVSQAEVAKAAEDFSSEPGSAGDVQRAWLRRVFLRSGVKRRGSVLANAAGLESMRAFYAPPAVIGAHGPSTAARMQQYAIEAPTLALAAAREALAQAAISPAEITHLITVTCTGFYAPGLDHDLITRLGLRPDVRRAQVGFMGCHAGFNALAAARDAVQADAEAVVLVCCVELCTLHFSYGWNPEKLVANALFADGASACVMGTPRGAGEPGAGRPGGGTWHLQRTASLLIPESRDAMTWRIGDHGFAMTLSPQLPALIGEHVQPWCKSWLGAARDMDGEKAIAGIRHWAIHPGGPRVLTSAGAALGLANSALHASEEVLAAHGNMSSATLLFLLQRLLKEAQAGETCVALGFGPGLMAEGLLLSCEE